jgi:hypothetical protein
MIYLGDRLVALTTTDWSPFGVTSVALWRHIGHRDRPVTHDRLVALGEHVFRRQKSLQKAHFALVPDGQQLHRLQGLHSPLH